ncbi:MAG: V-type ATP synthase subunit D [Deltaproteobacteria bacterium]|jgi:V/A-type H+-transporting ATPase subunit D|nr:V-type ATP synthase subunit D [Deltaproteobacteria bacterium]
MAEMIEGIKPTRMELLKLRKRVLLAEKGYKLLKEKRDALISEFLLIIKEVRKCRRKMERELASSFKTLTAAKALIGTRTVKQISHITDQNISLDLKTRNIMGVTVPVINIPETKRKMTERGYGLFDTSTQLDEAAYNFEKAIQAVVQLAEIEETVKRLALEVEKTKRRVNALEYIVIPRLKVTAKYIQMHLDEMARDSFLRLKKIKAVLDRKAEQKSA